MAREWKTTLLAAALVVPAAAAHAQEPSETSLGALVSEALARNPEIQALGRRIAARQARVPQAGALPDPMAMYGVMNEGRPIPFETLGQAGFSEVYLGISQEIPFPGKRGLREQVAREEVAVEELALEAARRKLGAQLAEAFYDLYAVEAASAVIEQHRALLQQLADAATTRFSVGASTQHDVLNAQVELSRILERASSLAERRFTQGAQLASFSYRPAEVSVRWDAAPEPTPLPELAEAVARAMESPAVRHKQAGVRQAEQKLALARRERLPDLGLNVTYHNRGGLDPYYTYGGTITLPVFKGRKQNKAIEEAAEELEAARRELDAARNQARYEVTAAFRMAEAAGRLLQLYRDAILKQSRLGLDSAIAQYRVGKIDFLTMLTSWRQVLDAEVSYHEQLAAHEKAVARIALHVSGLVSYLP
jgi:outer membrane protein TolC